MHSQEPTSTSSKRAPRKRAARKSGGGAQAPQACDSPAAMPSAAALPVAETTSARSACGPADWLADAISRVLDSL